MATREKCKSTAFALLQRVTPKSVITRKNAKAQLLHSFNIPLTPKSVTINTFSSAYSGAGG